MTTPEAKGEEHMSILKQLMPRLDQGPDYERGFIEGRSYEVQKHVEKIMERGGPFMGQRPVAYWDGGDFVSITKVGDAVIPLYTGVSS